MAFEIWYCNTNSLQIDDIEFVNEFRCFLGHQLLQARPYSSTVWLITIHNSGRVTSYKTGFKLLRQVNRIAD